MISEPFIPCFCQSFPRLSFYLQLSVDDIVTRLPGWKWGNEDGDKGFHGRVVQDFGDGWVQVQWEATGKVNSYRYGAQGAFDLRREAAKVPLFLHVLASIWAPTTSFRIRLFSGIELSRVGALFQNHLCPRPPVNELRFIPLPVPILHH